MSHMTSPYHYIMMMSLSRQCLSNYTCTVSKSRYVYIYIVRVWNHERYIIHVDTTQVKRTEDKGAMAVITTAAGIQYFNFLDDYVVYVLHVIVSMTYRRRRRCWILFGAHQSYQSDQRNR